MGTRADFYIGRGEKAEWIGSIAWDGNPDGRRCGALMRAESKTAFMERLKSMCEDNDFTTTENGWPWPWENSGTTDFAYAWDDGAVWVSMFGGAWLNTKQLRALYTSENEWPETPAAVFPTMKAGNMAAPGSKRSGIMVFGLK